MISFYQFTKFFEIKQKSEYGFQCNFYAKDFDNKENGKINSEVRKEETNVPPVTEIEKPQSETNQVTESKAIQSKDVDLNDNEFITKKIDTVSDKEKMEIRKIENELPNFSKKYKDK